MSEPKRSRQQEQPPLRQQYNIPDPEEIALNMGFVT